MPNNPDFARVENKGYAAVVMVGDVDLYAFDSSFEGNHPIVLARQKCDEINVVLNSAFQSALAKRVEEAFEEAAKVADEVAEQKKNGNHEMSYSVGYAMARRIAEAIRSRKGKGG